jgi:ubiquinone/menaquinone biosynthesis C-methylase UbiE
MNDRVKEFFESEARAFDSIYSGEKSRFAVLLDRLLRRDVMARFREVMQECGDVRGIEILDLGCGSGRYSIELARRGAVVTGIDAAGEMLAIARRLARDGGLLQRCSFIEGDFLSLPLDRIYSVTLAIGFFDYAADPIRSLRKMREVTRGRLIATFPRFWTWRAPVRKMRLALRGCPVHFYTRRRVHELMRESGWASWRVRKIGKLHFVVGGSGK